MRIRVQRWAIVAVGVLGLGWSVFAQTAGNSNEGADFSPKPPIQARSAADEAKSFVLPTGYRMELVLSDPDIVNPSVIEFDGNGRMYVVEFVTYMPNVEGEGQREPKNRISRWEDTNGDGTYDKHTVFADGLVLPRMVLPLDNNSILTNETDSDDVVKLTDTNGDGVADKRELFYSGVGLNRDGNLEHMQSGFVWGLDNWIYSTYNAFRFRWTPGGIIREATGNNNGQWGLSQDDDGKMWFVCAGCERGPVNYQVPIQYGAYRLAPRPANVDVPANNFDEYEAQFDIVWPIVGLSDTQGGMGRVRMPLGVLNHATATAGPDIVRGDRVPADLKGDLLYAEPVGRLIRRAKIVKPEATVIVTKAGQTLRGQVVGETQAVVQFLANDVSAPVTIQKADITSRTTSPEGVIQLRNAYPGSEFILSTDPLFRPVNLRTAPDGTVYIADMYRGIIQEAQWTGAGSYLRHKIQQYQLDKITTHGRIWRLRYDGAPEVPATPNGPAARALPGIPAIPAVALDFTKPNMLNETPAQLVAHLTHPNGWWRDNAQRLLVLKQDKSVVPALTALVRAQDNLTARFHALWTLEGLGALDAGLVRDAMKDASPRMRIQAIRASETLFKAGNKSFDADYRAATKDPDVDVAIQAIMTLKVLRVPDFADVIKATMASNKALGVQELGRLAIVAPAAAFAGRGGAALSPEQQQLMERGQTIFNELCFSCHGDDGRGTPKSGGTPGETMAPPIAGSAHVQGHRDFVIKTLLHGLTGPNNGKNYTEVMIPMGAQKDDWIAAVGSYIRNSFGNSASFIMPSDVTRVRAATSSRKMSWTVAEIDGSLPMLLQTQSTWKASASVGAENAAKGFTFVGWTTAGPSQAGQWYQVELPEVVSIAEVQYNAPAGRAGGPGARAGGAPGELVARGGGPAAPPVPAPAPAPAARGGRATAAPPAELQLQVSTDGKTWSAPLASASGSTLTTFAFQPTRAKFIKITRNTPATNNGAWTIQNLRVYQAATAK
ncbi:MAG: c-type cytochrome [Acidobacteriota bacterium]